VVAGPARGPDAADAARAAAAAAAAAAARPAAAAARPAAGEVKCAVCLEDWDVNMGATCIMFCCCAGAASARARARPETPARAAGKEICAVCAKRLRDELAPCPLCRAPVPTSNEESLAMLRRHVENENPAATRELGICYTEGYYGAKPSPKRAARLRPCCSAVPVR